MGDGDLLPNKLSAEGRHARYIFLVKDGKPICRARCSNPPEPLPRQWNLHDIVARSDCLILDDLPQCILYPDAQCSRDRAEWFRFLKYLSRKNSVAIAKFDFCEAYILPPEKGCSHVNAAYRMDNVGNSLDSQNHCESEICTNSKILPPSPHDLMDSVARKDTSLGLACVYSGEYNCPVDMQCNKLAAEPCGRKPRSDICDNHSLVSEKQVRLLEKNFVRADPSYLKTLGQVHSGWIFGAIAELIDNSRDAKTSRLDISIELIYLNRAGKYIPMLSIIDDGHGMNHHEIVRMTYFGHKQPDGDDPDHIGRFGIGFKTGAMRLGRDALVLTQTCGSRSIAFLSQSLNEGKDNLEIPVVSYCRRGQFMEVDPSVQSEALAKYNLKAIKKYSPFDKYLIGEKAGLFHERTGTQIYVWNLEEWGSDYCLEWHGGLTGGSSFHQGDILIRSRRVRSRLGQISQKVPLDYSLRSYLEVIFLTPRMRIYVQGSLVKSRPLAKSLNETCMLKGFVTGKHVHLTLGRSQLEWEQANGGIFLYWHGRLIEAYKRVGGMIHSADVGRGLIGVIDVTELMNDGRGGVWVHNSKQGFQDCEPYARLEEWLGKMTDQYWDKNFDTLQLVKGSFLYQPDNEWVQCNKCRKWRVLSSGYDSKMLPLEWFCYMDPFNKSCDIPEQKVEDGVVTISAKRSGYDRRDIESDVIIKREESQDKIFGKTERESSRSFKRIRKGLPRACKKVG